MLIEIITTVFVSLICIFVITGGIAMIFSSAVGKHLLGKAVLTLLVSMVTLAVLEQLTARLSFFTWIVLSCLAYAVWNCRRSTAHPAHRQHRGAERTPVVPPSSEHGE